MYQDHEVVPNLPAAESGFLADVVAQRTVVGFCLGASQFSAEHDRIGGGGGTCAVECGHRPVACLAPDESGSVTPVVIRCTPR